MAAGMIPDAQPRDTKTIQKRKHAYPSQIPLEKFALESCKDCEPHQASLRLSGCCSVVYLCCKLHVSGPTYSTHIHTVLLRTVRNWLGPCSWSLIPRPLLGCSSPARSIRFGGVQYLASSSGEVQHRGVCVWPGCMGASWNLPVSRRTARKPPGVPGACFLGVHRRRSFSQRPCRTSLSFISIVLSFASSLPSLFLQSVNQFSTLPPTLPYLACLPPLNPKAFLPSGLRSAAQRLSLPARRTASRLARLFLCLALLGRTFTSFLVRSSPPPGIPTQPACLV